MDSFDSLSVEKFLGVYHWHGVDLPDRRSFKDVKKDEVLKGLGIENFEQKNFSSKLPPTAIATSDLQQQCPVRFLTPKIEIPQQIVVNNFPANQGYVVPLFVAKYKFGVDLHDIDFVLGGSTLNVLATRNTGWKNPQDKWTTRYVVQRFKSDSGPIAIAKLSQYETDGADVAFQFERFVTQGVSGMEAKHDFFEKFEALQILNIGGLKILTAAEVDAWDGPGKTPIEIKAANPRHYEKKVMFQMISSGSQKLVQADRKGSLKGKGKKGKSSSTVTLKDVYEVPLRKLINEHSKEDLNRAQDSIIDALATLQGEIGGIKPFELTFDNINNGEPTLEMLGDDNLSLFPIEGVVEELFG